MRNLVANCSMDDCPLYCYEKEDSSWKLFCVLCAMYKHTCCVCMCKCIVFVVCRMCVIEAGRGGGLACAVMFMAVLMEEPKSSSVAKMSSNGPQNLAKYSAKDETHNLH